MSIEKKIFDYADSHEPRQEKPEGDSPESMITSTVDHNQWQKILDECNIEIQKIIRNPFASGYDRGARLDRLYELQNQAQTHMQQFTQQAEVRQTSEEGESNAPLEGKERLPDWWQTLDQIENVGQTIIDQLRKRGNNQDAQYLEDEIAKLNQAANLCLIRPANEQDLKSFFRLHLPSFEENFFDPADAKLKLHPELQQLIEQYREQARQYLKEQFGLEKVLITPGKTNFQHDRPHGIIVYQASGPPIKRSEAEKLLGFTPKNYDIVAVDSPGYMLTNQRGQIKLIRPAHVRIYLQGAE